MHSTARPSLSEGQTVQERVPAEYSTSTPGLSGFSGNVLPVPHPLSPPFDNLEIIHKLHYDDSSEAQIDIRAMVEKGFFLSGEDWTAYRRNYFSIQCSYTLDPLISGRALFLHREDRESLGSRKRVQAIGMTLSAVVDGSSGKTVELVQHTPKRDRGPQEAVQMVKLFPVPPGSGLDAAHIFSVDPKQSVAPYSPLEPKISSNSLSDSSGSSNSSTIHYPPIAPYLPLQTPVSENPLANLSGSSNPPTAHYHTFERIQFKSATANNGKRRAQQQFYHLHAELHVDVRQSDAPDPVWIKVAFRSSCQLVIRGRSPSHYSNEGPLSVARSPGAAGFGGRLETLFSDTQLGTSRSFQGHGIGKNYGNAAGGMLGYRPMASQTFSTNSYSTNSLIPNYTEPHESWQYPPGSPVAHGPVASDPIAHGPVALGPIVPRHSGSRPIPPLHTPKTSSTTIPEDAFQISTHPTIHIESTERIKPGAQNADWRWKDDVPQYTGEVLYDDSSVSSIQTHDASTHKLASISSFTSAAREDASAAERITELILQSEGILQLLDECVTLDHDRRLERNIRRLLKISAHTVRLQSSTRQALLGSRMIRRCAKEVARSLTVKARNRLSIKTHLSIENLPTSNAYSIEQFLSEPDLNIDLSAENIRNVPKLQDPSNQDQPMTSIMEDSESDDEISADDNHGWKVGLDLPQNDWEKAEHFIRQSEALVEFREGLLDFSIGLKNARRNQALRPQTLAVQSVFTSVARQLVSVNIRNLVPQIVYWMKVGMRPAVKAGFRRLEWICECGDRIYADFSNDDPAVIDELEQALHCPVSAPSNPSSSQQCPSSPPSAHLAPSSNLPSVTSPNTLFRIPETPGQVRNRQAIRFQENQEFSSSNPKYFATCSSVGGIYKVVNEIDVSQIRSDAEFFKAVQILYHQIRKSRKRWSFFFKPAVVEYVQFSVWNLQEAYVSICDRPECIPPENDNEYEFSPRRKSAGVPVPSELFIHYLEHNYAEDRPGRYIWVPRLPKRISKRVIDCHMPSYGWGIFIKEKLNGEIVFWMIVLTALVSIVVSILWSALKGDVQGGTSLGALLLALPPVILAATLFRIGESN